MKRSEEKSGILGMLLLCLVLDAGAVGPLYAAFPIAEVLLHKGTSLRNVWIFLGTWSTIKISMFLFEGQNLSYHFALTRYAMSFLGFLIAFLLEWLISKGEKKCILEGCQLGSGSRINHALCSIFGSTISWESSTKSVYHNVNLWWEMFWLFCPSPLSSQRVP